MQKEWDYTDEVYSPITTFYSASKATKVFTGTFLFAVISISKGYSRANPQETPYPSD